MDSFTKTLGWIFWMIGTIALFIFSFLWFGGMMFFAWIVWSFLCLGIAIGIQKYIDSEPYGKKSRAKEQEKQ